MSIATAITNAQQKVANAYTAVNTKGGTLPSTQNLSNLPTAINSIPTGGAIDSLTVTPTTSQQTITASGGVDGYSPITVNAVTSAIDQNISAGNIKSGVSILGVSGSVIELIGETRTVSITSTSGNTFTPLSGKNGITSIKVNPTNKALTITPSTSKQTKTVPSGYSGYGTITVNKVTSSIDSNITAGNIKDGVTILGVTGTYTGSSPSGTLNITSNGVYDVTNYASVDVSVAGSGNTVAFYAYPISSCKINNVTTSVTGYIYASVNSSLDYTMTYYNKTNDIAQVYYLDGLFNIFCVINDVKYDFLETFGSSSAASFYRDGDIISVNMQFTSNGDTYKVRSNSYDSTHNILV